MQDETRPTIFHIALIIALLIFHYSRVDWILRDPPCFDLKM
jgi:hypothetical protein